MYVCVCFLDRTLRPQSVAAQPESLPLPPKAEGEYIVLENPAVVSMQNDVRLLMMPCKLLDLELGPAMET